MHPIALIAGLVLYSVLHSLLAAPGVRRGLNKLIPPAAFRLFYNLMAVVLFVALWLGTDADYPILWDLHGLPAALLRASQVGAALLFLVALRPVDLLHFLGLRQLRGHMQERHGPVTRGAYAVCRHPLYLSVCIFFSAWPRMDLRWLIFAIWLWGYSFVGSIFEERRLETQFGQAYRDYRRRCPRLLPFRLSRARKA